MQRMTRPLLGLAALALATITGCSDGSDNRLPGPAQGPNTPPPNPFLADSVAPIGHLNSAQTDSFGHAGPTGPTERLSELDGTLTYTHMGPAHFGLAISPRYPNGGRVIWSNGGERISKLDYDSMTVIDEFFLEDSRIYMDNGGPVTQAQADADIASLDDQPKDAGTGLATLTAAIPLATKYLAGGLAGVYYLLSSDNVLYVGGPDSIIAYADQDPMDQRSPIVKKNEWQIPAGITGSFNSMNITYDGWLVAATDDGWLIVIKRDFSDHRTIQLTGAEVAPAWNQYMLDIGKRQGSATWVRNGPAIDEDGGIYIPSLQHMHKVIWDGNKLSTNEEDGAWVAPYSNEGDITVTFEDIIDPSTGEPFHFENVNVGTGATASLMGYDEEDQFVVITDGDEVMNMVLFWRNDIPADWQHIEGAPSRRIAGQLRADIGNDMAETVQTEQSVVVGGYGAFVVNNSPASKPLAAAPDGFYSGLAGHHPDFTPHGVQKFEWDTSARQLHEAWVNLEVSSVNSVPVISTGSNKVYTVGARNGEWTMESVDWENGESSFHFISGSSRYNTVFSGLFLDQEGRVIHTTFHGIARYERYPENQADN